MPWPTAKSFSKHNRAATGRTGQKAANIATGILKKTGDDGKAIRIANAYVKKHKSGHRGLINRGSPHIK